MPNIVIRIADYVSSGELVNIIHNKKAKNEGEPHDYTWYVHVKYLCSI